MLLRRELVYLRVKDSFITFYERYNGKFHDTGYAMPKGGYICVRLSPERIAWDNGYVRLTLKGSSLNHMEDPGKFTYIDLRELTSDKVNIVSISIKDDTKEDDTKGTTVSEYIEDSLNRMYQVRIKFTKHEKLYQSSIDSDGMYKLVDTGVTIYNEEAILYEMAYQNGIPYARMLFEGRE